MDSAIPPALPTHHGLAPHPCGVCCTRIEGLGVRVGGRRILRDINLHLHCGEILAVVGENGAGKTTLARCLLGELPHEGEIHFLDAARRHPDAPVVGYVPQRLEFDPGAPLTVLDLFAASIGRPPGFFGPGAGMARQAAQSLALVGDADLLRRPVGRLSGGELQRVLLALALTPLPNLLVLDEPVSGVDHGGRDRFYELISQLRRDHDLAVLLISHDLPALARHADRMLFLDEGIVCEGTPRQVLRDERVRRTLGFELAGVD